MSFVSGPILPDAQTQLGKVKQQIATIHSNFSMLDTLQNVSELLGDVSKTASTYEPHIITYDGYRYELNSAGAYCRLQILNTVQVTADPCLACFQSFMGFY